MLWIIAGNHKEAKTYAAAKGMRRDQWRYLLRADQLPSDLAGVQVAWIGSYANRPDYKRLSEILPA